MSDIEPDWLALREPSDHAARCSRLTAGFIAALQANPQIIDLGCGTGSNYRYLSPCLPAQHRWLCIDCDPAVLKRAVERIPQSTVRFEQRDLARGWSALPFGPDTAITMSAFLDMTSAAWLDQLADRCCQTPLLVAMTFSGSMDWTPAEPGDRAILREILQHQRSDQGFGPALGPDAAGYLARQLERRGSRVSFANSDWQLGPSERQLLQVMLGGIARRIRLRSSEIPIDDWLRTRESQLSAGQLRLTVGHTDLLAIPPNSLKKRAGNQPLAELQLGNAHGDTS